MKNYLKITENIYLVGRGPWISRSRAFSAENDCNVYLIVAGQPLALVDCGGVPNPRLILRNIRAAGFNPNDIKWMLLTHSHHDHVAALPWIQQHFHWKTCFHHIRKTDAKRFKSLEYGNFNTSAFQACRIDRYLKDGDKLDLGGAEVTCMELPGHTPDSIGYIIETHGKKAILSGDLAVGDQPRVGKGLFGWYNGFWGSDFGYLRSSFRRLLNQNIDINLPAHGMPHMTRRSVNASYRNCLKRAEQFSRTPQLDTMMKVLDTRVARAMEKRQFELI